MTRDKFVEKATLFLDRLFDQLKYHSITVDSFELDHICWRTETDKDFEIMETALLQCGFLFHKSIHNGRPISLIRLLEPILYKDRSISLIELPSPKVAKPYSNGFEHAEFVVPNPLSKWILAYPDLIWNTDNIDKPINPDVKLTFADCKVKFHPYTLSHVVKNLE